MRPVGARALKSAIDSLRPWLDESRVLDLFSGQGRFGVSALEEGASSVTFVEKDRGMAREISEQTEKAEERRIVAATDVFSYLEKAANSGEKYSIIFADPPFALWNETFESRLFAEVSLVASPEAIFLVKHPRRVIPSSTISGYYLWKTTLFGESRLLYFRYGQKQNDNP